MSNATNQSSANISEAEDYADFTVTSIVDPTSFDPNISPNRNHLYRAKSQSSFIISPHRKSSIILPKTGEKIQRTYSFWDKDNKENNKLPSESTPLISNPSIAIPPSQSPLLNEFFNYLKSLFTTSIFKAAIAYFIASLFVYSPTISNMLGSSDSKHLTCTVVVYFHPSRTVGSMLQALMFVSFSLVFGIGISLLTFKLISFVIDNELLFHSTNIKSPFVILTTLIICCTSLGLISFWKHRVCKQTFNTACSLAAILIISSVIKVYSRLLDTNDNSSDIEIPWEKITSIISCVICGCIISVTICFTVWKQWANEKLINSIIEIKILIGEILNDLSNIFISNDCQINDIKFQRLEISKKFKLLKSKLSKLDSLLEETMFECFVLGNERKYTLLKQLVDSEKRLVADLGGLRRAVEFKWEMIELEDNHELSAKNSPEPRANSNDNENIILDDSNIGIDSEIVESSEELIELFLFHLAPSTKSFVFTMNEILKDETFKNGQIDPIVIQYVESLKKARELYDDHQRKAIDSLYKQTIFQKNHNVEEKINQEEVAATCANFAFSVTQISSELEIFINATTSLLHYNESPTKSFNFLKIWKINKEKILDNERNQLIDIDLQNLKNETFSYKIWKLTKFTRGVDFQFGFRVGLGAFILSSLAFLDSTRHIFNEWRGEWALVTFCIIMNKSLGGTAMTIKWRFIGTFLGAFIAYMIWTLFYPHVILMAIFGFIVSIPCFNIILNWKSSNAFGRFILLTYNLTVLYSYTMSINNIPFNSDDDWEGGENPIIWEIAFHRYLGVTTGVIWALLITLTLFPVSARGRLKNGLSVLWLRMGIIWKRGALKKSLDEYNHDRLEGLRGINECHIIMNELRLLLKQAPMEIRLKGPFPIESYNKLMDGTEGILDAFENINSIVDFDTSLNPIESIVLDNLFNETNELQNRVFLIFYMLASALKIGLPMASDETSTEIAMDKLLTKLSDVRRTVESRREIGQNTGIENADFVLFYSYCLVTNSIVYELTKMMKEVVNLFGKLDEETLELK